MKYDYFLYIFSINTKCNIKDKLTHGEYENAEDFASDVNLIWSNCERYNGETHDITLMAKALKKQFDKFYSQLKTKAFDELEGLYYLSSFK